MNRLPWMEAHFGERQMKEIEFSLIYASDFDHGTDGHNAKIIIAQLASLLNSLHFQLVGRNYPENIDPIMGFDLKTEDDLRISPAEQEEYLRLKAKYGEDS